MFEWTRASVQWFQHQGVVNMLSAMRIKSVVVSHVEYVDMFHTIVVLAKTKMWCIQRHSIWAEKNCRRQLKPVGIQETLKLSRQEHSTQPSCIYSEVMHTPLHCVVKEPLPEISKHSLLRGVPSERWKSQECRAGYERGRNCRCCCAKGHDFNCRKRT